MTRTISSLGAYLASVDADGIQLHQYASASIRTQISDRRQITLKIETAYPDQGRIQVTVLETPVTPWTLTMRVPSWAHGAQVSVTGRRNAVRPGYNTVTRTFAPGDVVPLDLPITSRWTWPDPRVDALRGQVAVERGPIVLCLESTDLDASSTTPACFPATLPWKATASCTSRSRH